MEMYGREASKARDSQMRLSGLKNLEGDTNQELVVEVGRPVKPRNGTRPDGG